LQTKVEKKKKKGTVRVIEKFRERKRLVFTILVGILRKAASIRCNEMISICART